jgi:hypothetical protein
LAGRPAIFCGKACGTLEKSATTVKTAMPCRANAARESRACRASQISVDLAL